jgi:exonuclease SbcD
MKILHTSDWHIGKQLHKIDLSAEISFFLDWLINTVEKENIDLLLVAGDLFDQANPSQAAHKIYYDFLKRMLPLNCKIIITGGNHDSAAVINAPKALLEVLDVTVVGGAPEELEDLFISVEVDGVDLVVAAVPYLKDKDIRKSAPGESYSDKIEQIKAGLAAYFEKVNTHYIENHKGKKFIVMGHLFVQGAIVSKDSERDIQIGNQAGIEQAIFGNEPDYVALGHIHKPYAVSKKKEIHYSGSPVSFSFSEREDIKQVNIIDLSASDLSVRIIPVPKFRALLTFEGSFEQVRARVLSYEHQLPLVTLGEFIIKEQSDSTGLKGKVEDLMLDHEVEGLKIVKRRYEFKDNKSKASDAFNDSVDVADVSPRDMFEKRLEIESKYSDEEIKEFKNAFQEILEQVGGTR